MLDTTLSESQHVLKLSKELLDDIELSRLDADKLILKCARLARLAGSDEIQRWIECEMRGYNDSESVSLRYVGLTGRWIDIKKREAYWASLATLESVIKAEELRLSALRLPDVGGEWANLALSNVMREINASKHAIATCGRIKSNVLSLLHSFVSEVYYERAFAGLAESTFDRYKRDVDVLIVSHAGDVLKKIPSVIARLSEGSVEGISQALSTCRRIIESFADAIYPPTDATVELGGNVLKLDASKHQNRINAYIAERTQSASRRQRLRQNLSNLYDRVSTGVHQEVTAEEAYSLVLNVYLFLGEVLHLGTPAHNETVVE
jgi:hypothetical protein